ncbi:5729_t:CDS:2 [Rhizophagus irregularis]|nr:5729_t:CDS:2 [Rhizophagus irregularis]
MTKIISNNPFYLFYFTIHELMKPFSLCLMLAFILPNYILFMIYDFELQQTLPDFHQLIKKKSIDDFGERNDYIPNIQQNLENLEIIINKNTYINPDNEINQKYCQNSQCKFLFVYSNSEPETKTNVQFINTFAHLANKLNRTLVLTNVGTSRIDSSIHLLNTTMTINTWYSLNAFDKIIRRKENLEEFKGKGITNILDKLVCTSSDYFITAPSECTLKSSNNFIKDIINVREKLYYDYDNQKIQNIISKW